MRETGHVDLDEPFKGLFTQGMVVHETYQPRRGVPTASGSRRPRSASRRPTATAALSCIDTGEEVAIGSIEKMSKSKKNVVDPDDIIASYGADTARFFVLSDSPPERDVIWTEAGVEGAHRFVQRVWRARSPRRRRKASPPAMRPAADGDALAISQGGPQDAEGR